MEGALRYESFGVSIRDSGSAVVRQNWKAGPDSDGPDKKARWWLMKSCCPSRDLNHSSGRPLL